MIDPHLLRREPKDVLEALAKRDFHEYTLDELQATVEQHTAISQKANDLRHRRNSLSKEIGQKAASGEDITELKAQASLVSQELHDLVEHERVSQEEWRQLCLSLPNIPLEDTPYGDAEERVVWVKDAHGQEQAVDWVPEATDQHLDHLQVAEDLQQVHMETASMMSGSRFVVLSDGLARLHRALAQFMLEVHTIDHGYTEYQVPSLVLPQALEGTGQLPKFAEDLFRTQDGQYLSPTTEIQLVNLCRDQTIDESDLPLKVTGHSHCFRREAGSYGRDTRGMIRVHEFEKVELVQICTQEQARSALQDMVTEAATILELLQLPHRLLLLKANDMAVSSAQTFDIEVWLPGQAAWREIASLSICTEFQARRTNIRWRDSDRNTSFATTLNGSGVAVGRCFAAVLENHAQIVDGKAVGLNTPDQLRPYLQIRKS